jgi:hypothetical protein
MKSSADELVQAMNKKICLAACAFLLALPVVATLGACDTSSKPSSTCASGKTGLAAVATCSAMMMTPATPGATTPGTTTPGTTTPATAEATALVGDWGRSFGTGSGQVWSFAADGTYGVVSYALTGTSAQVEVTIAGKYSAAAGQLNVSAEQSTCSSPAGQDMLPYTLAGNQLSVTIDNEVIVYTKGAGPNSDNYALTYGCFDRNSGAFTAGAVHAL